MTPTDASSARHPRGRRAVVRGALLVFGAVGAAAGVYLLATVPPTADSYYPRCQLHALTGLHCPGCGTTRALHAALTGRPLQALAYNALIVAVLPVVGWAFARSLRAWAGNRPARPFSRRTDRWIWVLTGVMVVFGVARNLPWFPFTLLAPHEL
ncbi:MAG: DUF2752 domain-containing protein [Gemmataceae bacterium]|nr:DUF2752 domain-containing protein [Gemmataceae bacterium]